MKPALILLALLGGAQSHVVERKLSSKKEGYYEANAAYLEFPKSHALAGVINPTLRRNAERAHGDWIKQTQGALKELGKPMSPWEHELGAEVIMNKPRLASIITSTYDYSGGAHPNHWSQGLNFGFVKGKPVQLAHSNFFEPGFDCNSHISKLVLGKLRKREGADLVRSGEVKKMDTLQLLNFTVAKDGLTWYFNPYEVGPYAAGDFEIKLTFRELGPKFKRRMID